MLDATETVIGQTGHVYVGPVGSTFPASISEAVGDDFTEIGYVDTDGVSFEFPKNFQSIRSWQKRQPIRNVKGDAEDKIGLNLQQWNADTIPLAFGGGQVVSDGAGEYHYEPPGEAETDERALIIEASDGDVDVRWLFARVQNQAATTFSYVRTAESKLPLEFLLLTNDDEEILEGLPWTMQSNSDALLTGS